MNELLKAASRHELNFVSVLPREVYTFNAVFFLCFIVLAVGRWRSASEWGNSRACVAERRASAKHATATCVVVLWSSSSSPSLSPIDKHWAARRNSKTHHRAHHTNTWCLNRFTYKSFIYSIRFACSCSTVIYAEKCDRSIAAIPNKIRANVHGAKHDYTRIWKPNSFGSLFLRNVYDSLVCSCGRCIDILKC